MPTDSKGGFHLNKQRAMASDRVPSEQQPKETMQPTPPAGGDGGGAHTTLHDHGDGTYHTEGHDGDRQEHPHIGHALMHMASKHGDGGKHMHIHSDGVSHTTHHAGDDGNIEGPHEHTNIEELKNNLDQYFTEEGTERDPHYGEDGGGGYGGGKKESTKSLHGM